jgi:alcohol dehydrogenase class IV
MAAEAFSIKRLIDTNPRMVTQADLERIYTTAL